MQVEHIRFDPVLKALGCQSVDSTSLSKFWFSNINLRHYTKGREPHTAGITLSYYKKYAVIDDAFVLHEPRARQKVYDFWNLRNLASRAYWQTQLLEYYSSSKVRRRRKLIRQLDPASKALRFSNPWKVKCLVKCFPSRFGFKCVNI